MTNFFFNQSVLTDFINYLCGVVSVLLSSLQIYIYITGFYAASSFSPLTMSCPECSYKVLENPVYICTPLYSFWESSTLFCMFPVTEFL